MYSYALLEKGCYYLIQEKEEGPIGLIKVNMETDQCMYVSRYADETLVEWKKKSDPIFDILELLGDDKVKAWESIYNDNVNYEEDEE
ncbi:MAG: hypothetical protein Q8927_17435 [Bacteroidota bacterium]|nr:hypothetical protein [Bacteroidota bacterium]MDP4217990.1 hypothetical protein [Bacteroidota bacterium]MDP4247611.1 hypothetical protein [Bacteroidota bacterium]MDP4255790.1 hypothetical protein [Bacteroidota bacterium]MDP4260103.1 hypothetical protein [Bacteroidota bacterium]